MTTVLKVAPNPPAPWSQPNGQPTPPFYRYQQTLAKAVNDLQVFAGSASVALSAPGFLVVSGSPVMGAGTINLTLASEPQGTVFAAPPAGAGTPSFRALQASDIPALNYDPAGAAATAQSAAISSAASGAAANYVSYAASQSLSAGQQSQARSNIGAGTSSTSGTVTSVGMSVPPFLTVTPSSIITSGTFAIALAAQSANTVFAGPSSGAASAPSFRALAAADIPALSYVTSVGLTTPAFLTVTGSPVTSAGTLTVTLAAQSANQVFAGPLSGGAAAPAFRALVANDIPSNLNSGLQAGGLPVLTDQGAWSTWTPTVTAVSGTITTVGAVVARYCQLGRVVHFQLQINITTNGTGATGVRFTLPTTAQGQWTAYGRENSVTGNALQVSGNTTYADIFTYANAYPGGNGYLLLVGGTYESSTG